jgi:hypothetical protein
MTHELDIKLRLLELQRENYALRLEVQELRKEQLITECERALQAARPHAFNRRVLEATVNRCIAEPS